MQVLTSLITDKLEAQVFVDKTADPNAATLKPDELVVRVEAAPVNPSDWARILAAGSDPEAFKTMKPLKDGFGYQLKEEHRAVNSKKLGKKNTLGNEGAGIVVKTGDSPQAKALKGKVVSFSGASSYANFAKVNLQSALPHNEGVTPEQAASSFVNPFTVVAFVEHMRLEGHNAIIHTAAASQLGLMLEKYCQKEKVPLVNVVRKAAQEKALKDLGAKYVVRSDQPDFKVKLVDAIAETQATLAFDATGGGQLGDILLAAMEEGAKKAGAAYDPFSFYGTQKHKQLYIYGGLDRSPTMLNRNYGFAWSIGAWLMPNFLAKLSKEKIMQLRKAIADNITTIFATTYYKKVSMQDFLKPENFFECLKMETGKKFLILPNA